MALCLIKDVVKEDWAPADGDVVRLPVRAGEPVLIVQHDATLPDGSASGRGVIPLHRSGSLQQALNTSKGTWCHCLVRGKSSYVATANLRKRGRAVTGLHTASGNVGGPGTGRKTAAVAATTIQARARGCAVRQRSHVRYANKDASGHSWLDVKVVSAPVEALGGHILQTSAGCQFTAFLNPWNHAPRLLPCSAFDALLQRYSRIISRQHATITVSDHPHLNAGT